MGLCLASALQGGLGHAGRGALGWQCDSPLQWDWGAKQPQQDAPWEQRRVTVLFFLVTDGRDACCAPGHV